MYGDSGRMLREAMTDLLRRHRVVQELTGRAHGLGADATLDERAALGAVIQRYRRSVLTWCAQTTTTIEPYTSLNIASETRNPFTRAERERNPLIDLRTALTRTLEHDSATLPDLELLAQPQTLPYVESWRTAARATAIAERDLVAGPSTGVPELALSVPQAQAVLADIGTITQALIVLDRRCAGIPDWHRLHGADRLGWTALAAALDAGLGTPDLSVDRLGWHPPVKVLRGPAKPGILGVLQAEHNLLIRLHTLPTANALRQICDSQRLLSREAAPHAVRIDPDLGAAWHRRAATYARLRADLRDIGGVLGRGEQALAEAINAVHRFRTIPDGPALEPRGLTALNGVFARIDHRIGDIVIDALRDGDYLRREQLDRHATRKQQLAHLAKGPFIRAEDLDAVPAVRTIQEQLRPNATRPTRPGRPERDRSRAQLAAAITAPGGRRPRTQDVPGL
jgi:hypothetical protein